jgi:hypothetical protein
MAGYRQWLKGVRRRAAVRSRCWRWVEDAASRVSRKRFVALTAALTTAAVLGAGIAVAAKRAVACDASPPSSPATPGQAGSSLRLRADESATTDPGW